MASTQANSIASSSGSTSSEELRLPAAPLPLKRGEIGFRAELVKEETGVEEGGTLPSERHPADRDASVQTPAAFPPNASPAPASAATSDNATSTSLKKRKVLISFLKRKKHWGIQLGTLIALTLQLLLIFGTIAAWTVAGIALAHSSNASSNNTTSTSSSNTSTPSMSSGSSAIFVHVIFAIAFLSQCLFLERRVYVIRAQRYAFVHPGEILPSSRRTRFTEASVSLSPWNRAPLPTYAAALAQSGAGTGDVEDHLIAAPPPPAYGFTRGSTLLLSGFLDARLRAQRPVSAATQMSQQPDRPLSYASLDPEWEVIQDADRARRLEETLANMDRPRSRQPR